MSTLYSGGVRAAVAATRSPEPSPSFISGTGPIFQLNATSLSRYEIPRHLSTRTLSILQKRNRHGLDHAAHAPFVYPNVVGVAGSQRDINLRGAHGDDDDGSAAVPEVALGSGNARPMPAVGMGTASFPPVHEATKGAVLAAIEVGFRHFDTASLYGTERPLGDAVAEAVRRGLLASREEVFVTSKLWCTQNHPDLVLPSLRETLKNLQMEYLDLYLIHWPVSIKPGPPTFPNKKEDAVPLDVEGVWRAMEECQRLGLARAIGVSNFTTRHLDRLLAAAAIPPAVNQVELNPAWQQRTLRAYCADKGIRVAAYSPLGGQNWDGTGSAVLDSDVLAGVAKARGKTVAQVALRWIYEQGVTSIAKSYNKERLKQNLQIFDWELTDEDRLKISQIPQKKVVKTSDLFSQEGEFTFVDPADMDVVEE